MTLKEFIENFNVTPFETHSNKFVISNLTRDELYKLNKESKIDVVRRLSVSNECIYYCNEYFRVQRLGNRFFAKKENLKMHIYVTPKKLYVGKDVSVDTINEFLALAGIDWFRDIPIVILDNYFKKPSILTRVITGKIYNEETLYKFIGSYCFKMKNLGWRTIRKYLIHHYTGGLPVNIYDLAAFTKNIEQSIDILVKSWSMDDQYDLVDLVRNAIQLNQVVDLTWSEKRVRAEHQKQIELLNEAELNEKEIVPIYDKQIKSNDISLLNTEAEIFLEGKNMHHCLYSCYFDRIKHKTFMAFHMTAPEDCTFSIRYMGGKIEFDQIHLRYNGAVQPETKAKAKEFIDEHKAEILELFNTREESDDGWKDWPDLDLPYW